MPSWPAGLPYDVLRDRYTVGAHSQGLLKSPMQAGKTRMRRQYTVRVATMPWGREFTRAELAVFRAFLFTTLADGAAEFTMPIWDEPSGDYVTKTVQIRDGAAGVAEAPFADGKTLVSFSLDVWDL